MRGRKSNRGQLDTEAMRQAHGLFGKLEELQGEIGSGLPERRALPKTEVLDGTNLTGAWSGTAASYLILRTLTEIVFRKLHPRSLLERR